MNETAFPPVRTNATPEFTFVVAESSSVVVMLVVPVATITSEDDIEPVHVKVPEDPSVQFVTEVPPTRTNVFEAVRNSILYGIPPELNDPPVRLKPLAAAVPVTVTTVISLLVRAAVLLGLTSRIVMDLVPAKFPVTVIVSDVPATKFTSTKTVPFPLKPPENVNESPTAAPPESCREIVPKRLKSGVVIVLEPSNLQVVDAFRFILSQFSIFAGSSVSTLLAVDAPPSNVRISAATTLPTWVPPSSSLVAVIVDPLKLNKSVPWPSEIFPFKPAFVLKLIVELPFPFLIAPPLEAALMVPLFTVTEIAPVPLAPEPVVTLFIFSAYPVLAGVGGDPVTALLKPPPVTFPEMVIETLPEPTLLT